MVNSVTITSWVMVVMMSLVVVFSNAAEARATSVVTVNN